MSTDTEFTHLAWQREEKLLESVKYPMGSDPTGNLPDMFGVLDEETGLSLRGTFVINPKGVIMNAEVNYYNMGRNIDELLRKLRANKHLEANPYQACPPKWIKKGDKTLTPSEKLVGRVYEAYEGKGKKK